MSAALFARLRSGLLAAPPDGIGHDDYDHDPAARAPGFGAVKAAVLIPIVLRDEPMLLFTRRTEQLARHSGQVSFPGGRSEPDDITPVETALRETREETGIAPGFVTVAGFLGRYLTGSGFDIQPVVGVLADGFALVPDAREVAEIFEAPLAFFLDPANRSRRTRCFGETSRTFYTFQHGGHEIWGATAAIVVDLVKRLYAVSPS